MRRVDGSDAIDVDGTVVESERPTRLVTTWNRPPSAGGGESRATFDIEDHGDLVRLTVTHEDLTDDDLRDVSQGWPAVLSNLKSLLETGSPLPQEPWRLPARA